MFYPKDYFFSSLISGVLFYRSFVIVVVVMLKILHVMFFIKSKKRYMCL